MGATNKDELTDQQELFCQLYMIYFHGTKAAIEAKYSPKTAHAQASRLLKNVKIQNRLAELRASLMEKYEVSERRIMTELAILGFIDPKQFFNTNGTFANIKKLEDLPPEITRAITGVTIRHELTGTTYAYKFGGKTKALELMMKRLGLLQDKSGEDRADVFRHADKEKLKESYDKFRNGKLGNKK